MFEGYYTERNISYATGRMSGVIGAENLRVLGALDGGAPPYYRISHLAYDNMGDLRARVGPTTASH